MVLGGTYCIEPPVAFSLRLSAAPATWGGGGSPRHAVLGQSYVVVEPGGPRPIARRLEQDADGIVRVSSSVVDDDRTWFERVFRPAPGAEDWGDPVLERLAQRFSGLWALTDGGLFPGLVTSIVGQSISIASAMATQRRLATSFSESVVIDDRPFFPLPSAPQLADASTELIRASGVTWRRAEALHAIANEEVAGNLPDADTDSHTLQRELRKLPLVGPWTAASALLWGLGAPDAFPSGDVALLRAARMAYDRDSLTMKELDALAEAWRPYRATAVRLLWTSLLAPAW